MTAKRFIYGDRVRNKYTKETYVFLRYIEPKYAIVKDTVDRKKYAIVENANEERAIAEDYLEAVPGYEAPYPLYYSDIYGFNVAERAIRVEKIIQNGPATIIFWSDGDKTVVKCAEGDTYDAEKGVMMAYLKKGLGAKYYRKLFDLDSKEDPAKHVASVLMQMVLDKKGYKELMKMVE